MKGRITQWHDDKGYGFITSIRGTIEVFVHISEFPKGSRRPRIGEEVKFHIRQDDKEQTCAYNVIYLQREPYASTVKIGFAFLLVASVATFALEGEPWLLVGYALMSFMTYIAYAQDKKAAERGRWRTSEKTLHLLALLGGWPGALYAQDTLRHKTQKSVFKKILWLCIVLNVAAFIWTFSPDGRMLVEQVSQAFHAMPLGY